MHLSLFTTFCSPNILVCPPNILTSLRQWTVIIYSDYRTTSKDEMCNFYMMYYVDGERIAEENYCFTPGPPDWNWFQLDGLHPENAPLDASIIPGTTNLLKSTQKFLVEMEGVMEKQRQDAEDNLRKIFEALQGYQRQNEIIESSEDSNEVFEPKISRADDYYQPISEYNGFEGNNY